MPALRLVAAAVLIVVGMSTAGCGFVDDSRGTEHIDVSPEPQQPAPEDGPVPEPDGPAPEITTTWSCAYSPTYDDDWHNDVVCSNGLEQERPYLREWDDFVTEDEIMESAAEYEAELNSGR